MTCRWTTLRRRSARIKLLPDRRLRPLLAHGYEGVDQAPTPPTDFVIPAGVLTPLVVELEDSPLHPAALVFAANGSSTVVPGAAAPAHIETCLAPLGAYTLLGPAVADIGESIVPLEDLVGAEGRRLVERVQAASTWVARARLIDAFLLDRWARGPQPSSEVSEAWDLLVGGTSTIRDIARQVGWSHQHLITKFKQQVGIAPRLAARLLRLSRVWRLIDSGHSWARIAAESGYADQSHLVREFRQFTGTTPNALITEQSARRRPAA